MSLIKRKSLAPALLMAVLALSFLLTVFFTTPPSQAQKTKELGPPPPAPRYKPKPTPTPAPIEYDVVRITSNLVMVPVSVTDAQGNPVTALVFHGSEYPTAGKSGYDQRTMQVGVKFGV